MKDKVKKIREEVARIQLYSQSEVLKQVLDYIDEVQKEPVSDDLEQELYKAFGQVKDFTLGMRIAKWFYDMGKNSQEPVSEDLEKIVEEIAEPTILNAYGTKELARRLRNTICGTSVSEGLEEASKEWLSPQLDKSYAAYGETKQMELTHFDGYAMLNAIEFGAQWQKTKDESTTEDLGEYINELSKQFPEVSFAKLSRIAVRVSRWQRNQDVKNKLPKVINRTDLDEYAYQCAYDMSNDWMIENPTWKDVKDACKLGAKWQKQQDQSTIELAEDHAMLAGMEKMKEEMMAKAIDGEILEVEDNDCAICSHTHLELCIEPDTLEKNGLKDNDKVKVIVIKEN